jgi:hypothetical protein
MANEEARPLIKVEPPVLRVEEHKTVPMAVAIGLVSLILAMLGWFAVGISTSLAAHEKRTAHDGTLMYFQELDKWQKETNERINRLEELHLEEKGVSP